MDAITQTYNLLWELIIRPPRDVYNDADLGPAYFTIDGIVCERVDLQLRNIRGQRLQCSHYLPYTPKEEKRTSFLGWLFRPLRSKAEGESMEKQGCVIYLHGNSSSRVEALDILHVLLPRNISVFSLDLSGSGKSDGDYISLGHYEQHDVQIAIDYLRSSGRVSAIGLWGRSMGAATAILRAGQDPDLAACVLDSAFCSLPTVAEEIVNSGPIPVPRLMFDIALEVVRKEIRSRADFDIYELTPINSATQAVSPVLFGSAEDDTFVLPHHTTDLYDAWGGALRVLVSFTGGHNGLRPDWFFKNAAQFFETHLASYASGIRPKRRGAPKALNTIHEPPTAVPLRECDNLLPFLSSRSSAGQEISDATDAVVVNDTTDAVVFRDATDTLDVGDSIEAVDFSEATDAVLKALQTHANVQFWPRRPESLRQPQMSETSAVPRAEFAVEEDQSDQEFIDAAPECTSRQAVVEDEFKDVSVQDASDDGDIDDLEYLLQEVVHRLPANSWQRLLDIFSSQEVKCIDSARQNEDLRKEVRFLRRAVHKRRSLGRRHSSTGAENSTGSVCVLERDAITDALRSDLLLESRVAALAAQRRGESAYIDLTTCIDPLDDDMRDAAREAFVFLLDKEAAACDLPRLLSMIAQVLSWATNPDTAEAARLLSQVPEQALQHAHTRTAACSEVQLSEFPDCVPHGLQAVEDLPDNDHGQRVGLACVALCSYAAAGRLSLLEGIGSGLRVVLAAAARRPRHPELQAWVLVAITNCAKDLPADSAGASLACESAACCAASLAMFRSAPDILEHAARALTLLLDAHPRRVAAAVFTQDLPLALQEAAERFPISEGQFEMLHLCIAEALSALARAKWRCSPVSMIGRKSVANSASKKHQ